MNPDSSIIRSRRVVLKDGIRAADIEIAGGRIIDVREPRPGPAPAGIDDVEDLVVMPGVIDTHVHVNEPGRTEWEGFASATKAAAAGGVTTLVDMPLNSSPATTSVHALEDKLEAMSGQLHVDVGLWGGVVPGNGADLAAMWDRGVLGYKAFLVPSGVPEFPAVEEQDLARAMEILGDLGAPLLVHAEDPHLIGQVADRSDQPYSEYLESRPSDAERRAIERVLELSEPTGCRIHIVHLASPSAIPTILTARGRGVPVTVETCPHYLTFVAEEIDDGETLLKCAPPIRTRADRDGLWSGLIDESIDLIGSDHSPCPPDLKSVVRGSFGEAWGGVASLELTLSVVWSGCVERRVGLDRLADWMCRGPAGLAGLARKGKIARGYDADLTIWDPDATRVVDQEALHQRHPVTPYHGRTLHGVVYRTLLRGRPVYDRGRFGTPGGRWLPRGGS